MNTRKKSSASKSTRGGASAQHAKTGSMSQKGRSKKSSASSFGSGSHSGSSSYKS